MLEYPSSEIKIGSDKQNACPPPWHGLDHPKHPFLIHNCLRLGTSCPFDYVYQELIQPASFQVKTYESMMEEYPSSTHLPMLELDSWVESPLVLFLQIISTLIQQWETFMIKCNQSRSSYLANVTTIIVQSRYTPPVVRMIS
jgi:hypothetical protein